MKKILSYLLVTALAFTIGFSFASSPLTKAVTALTAVNFNAEIAPATDLTGNGFTFNNDGSVWSGLGKKVVIRIPDTMTIGTYEGGDVTFSSNSSANFSGGVVAWNATNKEVSYTLDANDTIGAAESIVVNFASAFVSSPAGDSNSGQYSFAFRLEDASQVVEKTGIALLAVNNTVSVEATVQEALNMKINDTSVNLPVDPSANAGVFTDATTTFNVSSNAANGFKIQAQINRPLTGTNYKETIANNIGGSENTFAYDLASGANTKAFKTSADDTGITDQTATDIVGQKNVTNTSRNVGTFKDTIHYYVNVDYETTADDYTATITYTAVPSF